MDYQAAEQDIIDRIAPFKTAAIDIQILPENQVDFKRPFEKAKITVAYKGSKWKDPASTGHMSQDEEVMFEFSIQSRTLRGDRGIYKVKALLIQALVGFAPTDCDKMYCKESGMTQAHTTFEGGVWTYTLIMCCRNVSVEDFEEDLSVILRKITNKNNGSSFDVPAT
jgi:Gp37 protein